ncbi:MAG: aldo/keto reductase [Candidatus Glassbacteria bacterium]|nr:aldo/keto reductase [Candidatus Glassbacteria bacterium]
MTEHEKIDRKTFLGGCGKAFLGLGLGVSCGKSSSREEKVAPSGSGNSSPAPAGTADSAAPADTAPARPKIAYRTLGRDGIEVTEVGFGASRTMNPRLVDYALELGINFLDTGRSYANGQNEVMVGKVIKGRRQQVVINSKVRFASLEKMQKDLESSLSALGTDYIDSMLIHGASKPEHLDSPEVREFFSRAREQGKVRTFGFSSHSNFIELLELAARDKFHEVIMVPYNFMGSYEHMLGGSYNEWDSQALARAIESCGKAGIDFIAMKGCSGGFKKEGTGVQTYRAALKWILQNPYMKTTATAMGNFQEIEEDANAMGAGALNTEDKRLLEAYAASYSAWYCRMCGQCSGRCPEGVDIAGVNRLHMYAVGYGGGMARQARREYAALGNASAAACEDCTACRVRCAYGLPLGRKLTDAHALLG